MSGRVVWYGAGWGTLFIDEIADFQLASQAKLLRVLERLGISVRTLQRKLGPLRTARPIAIAAAKPQRRAPTAKKAILPLRKKRGK